MPAATIYIINSAESMHSTSCGLVRLDVVDSSS